MSKNPFQDEDNLLFWLKASSEYQKKQAQNLRQFRSKNFTSKNPIIILYMQIKDVFHLTYKSVSLAVLGGILFTGTIAATAENLAPNQYKPSNLLGFNANKQQDKDPYTALAPDDKNYVANLESCDLALKYPRQVNGRHVQFQQSPDSYSVNIALNEPLPVDFSEYRNVMEESRLFSISCTNEKINNEWLNVSTENKGKGDMPDFDNEKMDNDRLNTSSENKEKVDMLDFDNVKTINLTSQELRDATGWLITESEITEITQTTYNLQKNSQKTNYIFDFKTGNKYYKVQVNYVLDKKDIQLQFTSRVKNKFSADILEAKKQDGSIVTSCLEKLNITHNSNLFKYQTNSESGSGLSISTFIDEQLKEVKTEEQAKSRSNNIINNTRVSINCENKITDIKKYIPEATKSDTSKIPFITEDFRKTIKPESVFEYKRENNLKYKESNRDNEDIFKDYIQIYFNDGQKSYSISAEKLSVVEKDFALKIGLQANSSKQ